MFNCNEIRVTKGLTIDFPLSEFQSDYVYFDNKTSNIIWLNDAIIGFYNVVEIESESAVTIEYALLKSFRQHHMGTDFLNAIVEIVSKKYSNMKKIILMIRYDNTISEIIAKKTSFQIDMDLMERISEEISNYMPYSKNNEYFDNKKLCLQKQ